MTFPEPISSEQWLRKFVNGGDAEMSPSENRKWAQNTEWNTYAKSKLGFFSFPTSFFILREKQASSSRKWAMVIFQRALHKALMKERGALKDRVAVSQNTNTVRRPSERHMSLQKMCLPTEATEAQLIRHIYLDYFRLLGHWRSTAIVFCSQGRRS